MKILKTKLKDVYEIVPEPNQDERGFFQRLFCSRIFKKHKLENKIVQINNSFSSKKGTTRGLHYQIGNAKECKILRCVKGSLVNIVVDVRKIQKIILNTRSSSYLEKKKYVIHSKRICKWTSNSRKKHGINLFYNQLL